MGSEGSQGSALNVQLSTSPPFSIDHQTPSSPQFLSHLLSGFLQVRQTIIMGDQNSDNKAQQELEGQNDQGIMGANNWIILRIHNSFASGNISVYDAYLKHGKFHQNGNKDKEIPPSDVNKIEVPPRTYKDISACGRSGALYGCEGYVRVKDGSTQIAGLNWNVPYSGNNKFFVDEHDNNGPYIVSVGDWVSQGASIGTVEVEISKKR